VCAMRRQLFALSKEIDMSAFRAALRASFAAVLSAAQKIRNEISGQAYFGREQTLASIQKRC